MLVLKAAYTNLKTDLGFLDIYTTVCFSTPSPMTLTNRLYGTMGSGADHRATVTLPQDTGLDMLKLAK